MNGKFLSLMFLALLCSEMVLSTVNVYGKKRKRGADKCECGKGPVEKDKDYLRKRRGAVDRVINGDQVNPLYKYPWMVKISENGQQLCGGSIIGPNTVLSAAHCFVEPKTPDMMTENFDNCSKFDDGKEYCQHKLGDITIQHVGKDGMSDEIQVTGLKVSHKFSQPSHLYDVAIVTTEKSIPCNHYTRTVCLPTLKNMYDVDKEVIIAGWGLNKVGDTPGPDERPLLEAKLKIAKLTDTDEKSKTTCLKPDGEAHFCALGKNQNACNGDSGGPIFGQSDGVFYVLGVSSWGTVMNCSSSSSEYYTNLNGILPWIKENMG